MVFYEPRYWQTFKKHFIPCTNITNLANTANDLSNIIPFCKIVTWPGSYYIWNCFGGDLLRIVVVHEIVDLTVKIVNKYASQPPPNRVEGKTIIKPHSHFQPPPIKLASLSSTLGYIFYQLYVLNLGSPANAKRQYTVSITFSMKYGFWKVKEQWLKFHQTTQESRAVAN